MAGFDPFANQGGAAAWDPDHPDDSRAIADELLGNLDEDDLDDLDSDDDLEGDLDGDSGGDSELEFDDEYPEPYSY